MDSFAGKFYRDNELCFTGNVWIKTDQGQGLTSWEGHCEIKKIEPTKDPVEIVEICKFRVVLDDGRSGDVLLTNYNPNELPARFAFQGTGTLD